MPNLSVIVPLYNKANYIKECVQSILDQPVTDFELLVIDDCSTDNSLKIVQQIKDERLKIIQHQHNSGLLASRNTGIENASGEMVTFLDADVIPTNTDFISNYLEFAQTDKVIFGGILYPEDSDGVYKDSLHYIFGQEREAADAKRGGMSFSSANFMIPKALFQSIRFDESIKGYGYEDVLLHQKIKSHLHVIDNPVYHLGIEISNPNYLLKIKEGLRTLAKLYAEGKVTEDDIKLIGYYEKMKKYRLRSFYNFSCRLFSKKIEKKITQKDPDIHLFDLYRLNYFTDLMRKSTQDA